MALDAVIGFVLSCVLPAFGDVSPHAVLPWATGKSAPQRA